MSSNSVRKIVVTEAVADYQSFINVGTVQSFLKGRCLKVAIYSMHKKLLAAAYVSTVPLLHIVLAPESLLFKQGVILSRMPVSGS